MSIRIVGRKLRRLKSCRRALGLGVWLLACGCQSLQHGGSDGQPEPPTPPSVARAAEEVVVRAWAEPAQLGERGGVAQILVRLQKRNRQPYSGVEVRIESSSGVLYSEGRRLVTDASGMTRDRLTTHATARITVNAGGTLHTFRLPVAPDTAEPR